MTSVLFNEFALLLALTALIGFVAVKLKQPLILAFIIVGIIAGPNGCELISAHSQMDVLASFGVTLLLFIVGLKLDVEAIRAYGIIVMLLGISQMILTTLLGYLAALALGIAWMPALFIGMALAFSSTIIIIKLLSDEAELDSLYGRIAVGILIVQDVIVVIAIIVLSSLNAATRSSPLTEISVLALKGLGFLLAVLFLARKMLPYLLELAAQSRELLVLFALSFAAILAVSSEVLGFGKEIGGFLAGIALASSQFRESIAARLDTVRNLLLVFFFINLGAALKLDAVSAVMYPAIVLSIFVLFAKPIIVFVLMGIMRFRKRTAFMTSITMGQVSEFSLILAALGHELGYIHEDMVSLIILVSLVTIALSTYLFASASHIYNFLAPFLTLFERDRHYREDSVIRDPKEKINVIVYGYGRHGEILSAVLEAKNIHVLGVDFDPRKVHARHRHHVPLRYGDAEDMEFLKTLPLSDVQWVVSTIPSLEVNHVLVAALRELKYKGKVALSAYQETDIEPLNMLKVDLVLIPYRDAAVSAAEQIAGH